MNKNKPGAEPKIKGLFQAWSREEKLFARNIVVLFDFHTEPLTRFYGIYASTATTFLVYFC